MTAFIIEFYRLLQEDTQELTVNLLRSLTQAVQNQSAGLTGTAVGNLSSKPFAPPRGALWTNALWFSSLTCSLGTAMAAILVKQWLQFYNMDLNHGTAQQCAQRRQHRYNALIAWAVPTIISLLPMVLHVSVVLFALGLVVVLWEIDITIAILVLCLVAGLLLLYTSTVILPLIYDNCPYKSSASVILKQSLNSIEFAWDNFKTNLTQWSSVHVPEILPVSSASREKKTLKTLSQYRANLEQKNIQHTRNELNQDSLVWLFETSHKKETQEAALAAVSQLHYTSDMVNVLLEHNILQQLADKAHVYLPSRSDTSFWKMSDGIDLEHPAMQKVTECTPFMQSLISVWQHPDYLKKSSPPAISFDQVDSSHSWLLGDWTLLWRLVRKKEQKDIKRVTEKGWDISCFVAIICTEVFYYQIHVGPRSLPTLSGRQSLSFNMDEPNPFYDLYDFLEIMPVQVSDGVLDGSAQLLLLETLKFVLCKIDVSVYSETSQQVLLLLVQTFKKYHHASHGHYKLQDQDKQICLYLTVCIKLIMCKTTQEKENLLQNSGNFSNTSISETLSQLVQAQISILNRQTTRLDQLAHTRDIVTHSCRQLYLLALSCEIQDEISFEVLLDLPAQFIEDLIDLAVEAKTWSNSLQMQNHIEILLAWFRKSDLAPNHKTRILTCLHTLLKLRLRDAGQPMQQIDQKIMAFMIRCIQDQRVALVTPVLCDILYDGIRNSDEKLLLLFAHMDGPSHAFMLIQEDSPVSEETRNYWKDFQWAIKVWLIKSARSPIYKTCRELLPQGPVAPGMFQISRTPNNSAVGENPHNNGTQNHWSTS